MRKHHTLHFLLMGLTYFFTGCSKNDTESTRDNCTLLQQLGTRAVAPVMIGDPIRISADHLSGASYYWTGPGGFESNEENPLVTNSAEYYYNGWYYVTISYPKCRTKRYDSVFVDVNFPQGTPSCSPLTNNADFSNISDQRFYSIRAGAASGDGYEIVGNSTNGDLYVTFSNYWTNNDLEDGIYYTTTSGYMDPYDYNKVHIADVNQSIYWVASEGQPVYVSHKSGKQMVTLCGLHMSGDLGGYLFETSVDAQIRQP